MESYNAILIKQGKIQNERIKLLRELAVQQMQTLLKMKTGNSGLLQLSKDDNDKE